MDFKSPEDIPEDLSLGERVEGYTGFVEDFIKTYLPSRDQQSPLSALREIENALTNPLPYDPRQLFDLTTKTANNFSLIIRALGTT